jgi:hypothetical protein
MGGGQKIIWGGGQMPHWRRHFSYVFRLQYPRVLHCRIVPIEKLKTLVALESLERKKPPITHEVSESKINNLKVTRKFAKIPRAWAT